MDHGGAFLCLAASTDSLIRIKSIYMNKIKTIRDVSYKIKTIRDASDVELAMKGQFQYEGKQVLVLRGALPIGDVMEQVYKKISEKDGYFMSPSQRGLARYDHYKMLKRVTGNQFNELLVELFVPAEKLSWGILILDAFPRPWSAVALQGRWLTDRVWEMFPKVK
jgi:hypothetical protein